METYNMIGYNFMMDINFQALDGGRREVGRHPDRVRSARSI